MTIEETITQATLLKDGVGKDAYKYEILTSLIDIAKKYQEIEQGSKWAPANEVKDLSKRVEALEKQMKEDKEAQLKKLKAEIDYENLRLRMAKQETGINKRTLPIIANMQLY